MEMVLKGSGTSIWLRNAQLAVFGAVTALAGVVSQDLPKLRQAGGASIWVGLVGGWVGLVGGFGGWVWLVGGFVGGSVGRLVGWLVWVCGLAWCVGGWVGGGLVWLGLAWLGWADLDCIAWGWFVEAVSGRL